MIELTIWAIIKFVLLCLLMYATFKVGKSWGHLQSSAVSYAVFLDFMREVYGRDPQQTAKEIADYMKAKKWQWNGRV